MGRTILTCETNGKHKIEDDDAKNEEYYQTRATFKEDMDALLETNPFAHDLVTRLFAYNISAKDVYNHYYFWKDGAYLKFMERVSNAIDGKDGDKTLLSELRKCKSDVFGSYWKVDEPWNTKLRADTDYNDTRIDELLRLIRNASYHLNREDRIVFEKYIFRKFPRLFYSVVDAVEKYNSKFFKDYFTQ